MLGHDAHDAVHRAQHEAAGRHPGHRAHDLRHAAGPSPARGGRGGDGAFGGCAHRTQYRRRPDRREPARRVGVPHPAPGLRSSMLVPGDAAVASSDHAEAVRIMQASDHPVLRDIVLVGGGHSHV
ncbi:MAG: hypothetical protein ACK56I_08285, partial [bacterium]